MLSSPAQKGFTLIELLVVITILSVIASFAIPSYQSIIENRRLIGAAEALNANLQHARSSAIKRNRDVHINFTVTDASTWCYGLTEDNVTRPNRTTGVDPEVTCDCANTPANCTLDGTQQVVSSTDYKDVQIATTNSNTAAGNLSADTVSGTITPSPPPDVSFNIGTKTVIVKVSTLGQIQICKPTGSTLPSYKECP